TTFRGAAGRSFRTPTLYDLYRTWKYGSTTYQSNPDLKPEKAYSYEIGVDQEIGEQVLARITGYYNDVSDLIYSLGGTTKIKQNVGKVQIYGIETDMRADIFRWLSVFSNYTFNISKIMKHSDMSLKGKYLTYTPRNKYSIGGIFKIPKIADIEVAARHIGHVFNNDANTQKIKDYFVLDFTLSRKFTDNFDLSIKVENAADKRYLEYWDTVAPDRMISARVTVRF
ncbi:MAG: TonB-dependent receptor, partial [Candidatus Omnitrophica bacterium]|nr:TonB-dependent receptor [Candidatus Omnitrophota bacterium]